MIDPSDSAAVAELVATAYHEAGHAVIATILGLGVHHVSIRPADEYLGHWLLGAVDYCPLDPEAPAARDGRLLLAHLGGLAAQRLVDPDCPADCGRQDEFLARSVEDVLGLVPHPGSFPLLRAYLLARRAALAYGRLRVVGWVERYRPAIEVVAGVLLERGELTGGEVREIVLAALGAEGSAGGGGASTAATGISTQPPSSPAPGRPAPR